MYRSGVPISFQALLCWRQCFTPPHFFNFMLPLPQAVNAGIALHVFLAGFFMYLWAAYRRLHPLACLMAAVLLMFSGPYFMHVFAGHVGNLNAMTWAPLIFLAVDGMMDKPALKWGILGIFNRCSRTSDMTTISKAREGNPVRDKSEATR